MLADKLEFVGERIPPSRAGYLLNDQKVTEESPWEIRLDCGGKAALSSMIFSPGPPLRGLHH